MLNDRLYYVFFHGLSNPAGESGSEDAAARTRRGDVPFLNGGLFEMQPYDEQHAVDLPNDTFADILNLFERYNFTITESTPLDIEVAVDPEMLGKVFEELVTGRHASGSYYTPRAVVSFMCRESLKLCLQTQTTESAACLTQFVDAGDATGIRDSEGVLAVLQNLRVCDPACGSGAYLLGMMGELLRLRDALFQSDQTDSGTVYERKLEIIRKNLYGVDRDDFAVNIAMLRLWLSLTVDYEGAVPEPLPNLDYKVATGDSLTGAAPEQMTLDRPLIQEIQERQAVYFGTRGDAKRQALREQIATLRADLQGWQDAPEEAFVWQVEFPEVFQAGGFDVVIGNPPYVRQELIKAMKPTYKRLFPEVYVGTADLYVYFYKRGTELLRRHGILAYISSNKFLRAAYGRKLRTFFSDTQRIQRLLDFGSVAVFKASVDTCILILENATSDRVPVSVATFREASDVLRLSAAFRERAFRLHPRDLSAEGWTLASPETVRLLRKLETTGTPLGEYVDGLWRGVVTGYNKAFIIDAAVRQRLISEDPKSDELIKPLLRGRDLRKWRTDSTGQYLIFTRQGVEIDRYPAVKKHLSQYREALENRAAGRYQWYEIQANTAYYDKFEKPKILYPEISKSIHACYDTMKSFGLDTTHFIPTYDLSLLAILNSTLLDWYARHKFQSLNDPWTGGLRFKPQYMRRTPIADRTDAQKAELSRLVEQILADPESEGVRDIEREIDAWVYRVYGLTDAEIALIEQTYREAGMAR